MNLEHFDIVDFPCAVYSVLDTEKVFPARCGLPNCIHCNKWDDAHKCNCFNSYKMPALRKNNRNQRVCSKCGYKRSKPAKMSEEQISERNAEICASDYEG